VLSKCTIARTVDRIAYRLVGQEMLGGGRNEGRAECISQIRKTYERSMKTGGPAQ
jgi:hypothetical protein